MKCIRNYIWKSPILVLSLLSSMAFTQSDSSGVINSLVDNSVEGIKKEKNIDIEKYATIFIAVLSLLITVQSLRDNRKHNRNSLKPIINVIPYDYSNCILIELVNEGVGTAIINNIVVEKNEHEKKESVYHWMPTLPEGISYNNYLTRSKDIPMRAGKIIQILEIRNDELKTTQRQFREQMRGVLRQLTIRINFTDVYGSKFHTYSKKLDLYARVDNG